VRRSRRATAAARDAIRWWRVPTDPAPSASPAPPALVQRSAPPLRGVVAPWTPRGVVAPGGGWPAPAAVGPGDGSRSQAARTSAALPATRSVWLPRREIDGDGPPGGVSGGALDAERVRSRVSLSGAGSPTRMRQRAAARRVSATEAGERGATSTPRATTRAEMVRRRRSSTWSGVMGSRVGVGRRGGRRVLAARGAAWAASRPVRETHDDSPGTRGRRQTGAESA